MIVKLLNEHYFKFQSLTGGCRGSSGSTLVKISNCWNSHATAHMLMYRFYLLFSVRRFKRQSSSLNLYQQLAAQSGGLYISTNKGNISSVAGILMVSVVSLTIEP